MNKEQKLEMLQDAMKALERDVEWNLTEVFPYAEVLSLLAPVRQAINDKVKELSQ